MTSEPSAHSRDETVASAVEAVRRQDVPTPEVALILGSGLGELAEAAHEPTVVRTDDIPGYPASTVEGHHGRLVFGRLEGRCVVFVQGRVHLYEGYPVHRITMPVRLVEALGAERLVVTNSAGGINRTFRPGTLMFLTGHLNMAFEDPGGGTSMKIGDSGGDREWTSLRPFYDRVWTNRAEEVALEEDIDVQRGVYAWTLGPSYETPAEIRALERLGADAVGMSTVPEVVQARQIGMRVIAVSTITNWAAGLGPDELDHEEVLDVGRQVRGQLKTLVRGIVRVSTP